MSRPSCQCLDIPEDGPVPWGAIQECGKPATYAYVYRFDAEGCFRRHPRQGETLMCEEHYTERRASTRPHPDNLVPVEDQWRKL